MGHPYENNGIYVKCVGATRQGSLFPGRPEGKFHSIPTSACLLQLVTSDLILQSGTALGTQGRMFRILAYGLAVAPAPFAFLPFSGFHDHLQVVPAGGFAGIGQPFVEHSLGNDQQGRQVFFPRLSVQPGHRRWHTVPPWHPGCCRWSWPGGRLPAPW